MWDGQMLVKPKIDLTGMKFGVFTVLKQCEDYINNSGHRITCWECLCECGNISKIINGNLKRQNSCCVNCKGRVVGNKRATYNFYELNIIDEHGEYGIGYCSNTNSKFYFDMDDYEKIKDYHWHEHDMHGYHHLVARKNSKTIRFCTAIGCKYYDHIDRNPLNNRKHNLRLCTQHQNTMNNSIPKNNTSGFIGVIWNKKRNRWVAQITFDYKNHYLGQFKNKEDAIVARLKAEKEYFGEFAPQQHLYEQYGII